MKKTTLILVLSIVLFSCKNSEEKTEMKNTDTEVNVESNETSDNLYRGDFIYIADAAVLKGSNFIYGVTLDEMATELAKQVAPVKETEFDMVEVAVKGIITPKPEGQEGWDEILTIKEIVMVSKTPSKIDIKIEDSKE
mgnify:CR=1 FL=1